MLKRTLLVVLAVSLFAVAGCPELKTLRRQNANLETQLTQVQQERDDLLSQLAAVQTQRDQFRNQLSASQQEAARMSGLLQQLRDEKDRLDQQRRELSALVKEFADAGINVEERGEGNFIVMENEILFDLGKADLKDEAKAALDKVADYLVANPQLPVRIDGHTDGTPIKVSQWEDNYHLSAMRAHAVMRYLASKGVDPTRMYIVGFGPNRPRVEPEEPQAPVAENRRVEILLVPQGARSVSEILGEFLKQ